MKVLTGLGLAAVVFFMVTAFRLGNVGGGYDFKPNSVARDHTLRLLAVGDVNLGRQVGQGILNGDTLYPFAAVADTFAAHDIVFANLECTLSEQGGETQHPRNNLVFTGPPAAARSLRLAGVTVVSTANNHALDYGFTAHSETMQYLAEQGILFAGTAAESEGLFEPAIIERNGLRVAFFACTDIMNIEDTVWKQYVASADTSLLLPRIRRYRESSDFIVVSYHGGQEYASVHDRRTEMFARAVLSGGADLFLGHHPHVPYGLAVHEGKYIVYSLGNFVFRQPDRFWTQRSFALSVELQKNSRETSIASIRIIPVLAGNQPSFVIEGDEAETILERIRTLSPQIASSEATPQLFW